MSGTEEKRNTEKIFTSDRVMEYLVPYMDDYLFDQLTDDYLEKVEMKDILSGIPVPFNKHELTELTGINLARSMAAVIGCNPEFEHAAAYKEFISRAFNDSFVNPLIGEGMQLAEKGEFEKACILFRAAIVISPENKDALYCYARACRDCYEVGEDEEYVGRFKAESLEAFEKLTIMAPEFEMGYYYLAYGYLNLGLYTKAQLTFKTFLGLTDETHLKKRVSEIPAGSSVKPDDIKKEWEELREEAQNWIEKLDEPIKIEAAYNEVLSGRYERGIELLEPYVENEGFNKWWPLYFYLGISHEALENFEKAEWAYKKVLEFSPSNTDAMEGLIRIGEHLGNDELTQKYKEKIKVIQRNREEEKAEKNKDYH